MLTETQKSLLTSTRGDIHRLTLTAVALLRGRANLAELNAMAAMCKPGKTKHLSAEARGILAYQSTLDRFATLVHASDTDGILADSGHKIPDSVNPSDACVEATSFEKVTAGKATLIKDHGLLTFARGLYIQLQAKYGDRLKAERTLTLEGNVKRSVLTAKEKAKKAYDALSDAEKAELISSITGIQTAEPEVLEVTIENAKSV